MSNDEKKKPEEQTEEKSSSRRGFLKDLAAGTLGAATLAGAATLLTDSTEAEAKATWSEWFQKNYRLMTDEEKKESIARLEQRYTEEYGKKTVVDGSPAM
ncbi:MAG: twin-arginine translocation signal domain-containing protein, partial [Deltaproteobacteria bacterium]|nr:twin-arginine translocation signal domain-containing protein [Deltaproteobacteria bacterium]